MEIQDKYRVKLLNAKCEVVCKVDSIYNKIKYGEDVSSCCKKKLFAAIKLINRLECFCFEATTENKTLTDSEFQISNQTIKDEFPFIPIGSSVKVVIDGVVKSHITVNEETNVIPALTEALDAGLFDYESVTLTTTVMSLSCDVESVSVVYVIDEDEYPFNFSVLTEGVCEVITTECHNCIEQPDLPKMYEVLSYLLQ